MKRVILTTVVQAVATVSIFAQATVRIGTVHVSRTDGSGVGAGVYAQLAGAPGSNAPESDLMPALPVSSFRTGAAAGQLVPFTATFNNIPPNVAFGSFEVIAWDNTSGLYPTWTEASAAWQFGLIPAGRSVEFTLAFNGVTPMTPTLSFTIGPYIPEPSAAVLLGLGAAAFLYVGRRK